MGYLFLLPLRKLWEHPRKTLEPWITKGDTVFELGPAMGYFTLDLARLVGPDGQVICAEVQPRMLEALKRRLAKAGLSDIVDARLGRPDNPCIDDLTGAVDFAFLHHVIHEVSDPARVIGRVSAAMRPGGKVILAEPNGHVSKAHFLQEVKMAQETGLRVIRRPRLWRQMTVVMEKSPDIWDFRPAR
jgi:predicted O-methyltransferase YrrM